ncbi:hypothetical protein PACTADRAFT_18909 [Pachysolen tannophilus NRRL Y-2460]|uniref:Inhibitor I9 domain-containing protein n=1 Tax=Pachysolen tannophilus NRRL Y-2460 TaxID=669874 RepID=A0A1E4TP25_PACTA|nr:hypothetical protein PACTADRAFT_18909 [Pachysolen tannophilus NRRL Y-2460]
MAEEKKSFIITLKETVSDPVISKIKEGIKAAGGEINHEYSLIKGFSAKLPSFHAETLKKDENIVSVEEDKEVHINK